MASNFKELIAQDLANVFLDTEEFGEFHDIDGEQITCVLYDTTQQNKAQEGVYESVTMLFVNASSLSDRPVPEQHMRIDGDLRLVRKCDENMGMLEITLEANEA